MWCDSRGDGTFQGYRGNPCYGNEDLGMKKCKGFTPDSQRV
jgi:hypothetical protein